MASTDDVATVRANTNVDAGEWSDDVIGALVDASSVVGASATIWTRKAAQYADLVDTSEAGARENLSQLHKQALSMAAVYAGQRAEELAPKQTAPRVSVIERSV